MRFPRLDKSELTIIPDLGNNSTKELLTPQRVTLYCCLLTGKFFQDSPLKIRGERGVMKNAIDAEQAAT